MAKSELLFELIRSMTMSEKRYFKLFADLHADGSDKNYLRLFDAIDRQKNYDESKLDKLFGFESGSYRLSRLKNYLYKLILKSMRSYDTDSRAEFIIKDMLRDVQFLFRKNLINHCQKLLRKAKKVALEYDSQLLLLEIIEWEINLFHTQNILEPLTALHNEQLVGIEKIRRINRYNDMYSSIYAHQYTGNIGREVKGNLDFRAILNHELIKDWKAADTFEAQKRFLQIKALSSIYFGKTNRSIVYYKKLIDLFDSNPVQIRENPGKYVIGGWLNLLIEQYRAGYINDLSDTVEKLNELLQSDLLEKEDRLRGLIFFNTRFSSLSLHLQLMDFEKALELSKIFVEELPQYERYMDQGQKMSIFFNLSYAFFLFEKWHDSLKLNNKVLELDDDKVRVDIGDNARIYNLMIHYELGNLELVGSLASSYHLLFENRKRLTAEKELILSFFYKVIRSKSDDQQMELFNALKKKLGKFAEDSKSTIRVDRFIIWLESKIGNRSFAELIKKAG